MQAVNYGTSMKDIPYGGHSEYIMQLTHSTKKLTRHMRWAAKFKLDPPTGNYEEKNNFGFPSQEMPKLKPEHSALLKPFESKMADIIKSMKFRRNISNPLQNKLHKNLVDMAATPGVIIAADKNPNHYVTSAKEADRMLHKHITKDYKLAPENAPNEVTKEARTIASELDIAERVPVTVEREAFGTLKDHKENFENNPKMRLINPCKPELGKVSKQLLDPIIATVKEKSGLLQFKNTASVLQWFQPIQNKQRYKWIIFDLLEYYPSISEKLLTDALNWAQTFTPIDEKTKEIILYVRKTFLFYKGRAAK